jgi:hypothetical protein
MLFVAVGLLAYGGIWTLRIKMPGSTHRGSLPPLSVEETALRDQLRADVFALAGRIGERNVGRYENLRAAANYLREELSRAGYQVEPQKYSAYGLKFENLVAEIPGSARPDEIVIVGGHYDSVEGSPGANDNATGAAAVLALARQFAHRRPARTLRFIHFVNEEPPHSYGDAMGSVVYARRCRARNENITAMFSIETIGYYSDDPQSQQYPFPMGFFYPSTANFIAFVGNTDSQQLVRESVKVFRESTRFPSEGGAVPPSIPGVGWSDHWSFWQEGYPGVMVTDTALYRYPHYHTASDTPEKVDYERLARVVAGLERVILHFVQ